MKQTREPQASYLSLDAPQEIIRGSFRVLFLYDVAEALNLARIRELIGPRGAPVERGFRRRTPEYVRFETAPIIEPGGPIQLSPTGEPLSCYLKYYAYAVVVVQLEIPFECDWKALMEQASRWMDAPDLEAEARRLVTKRLQELAPAVIRPNQEPLQEDYLIVNLHDLRNGEGEFAPTTTELLSAHGNEIVQLVRGELTPLAPKVRDEILDSGVSYYRSDFVVIGSAAALVYDRPDDIGATNQVLEYAKMQLLEFRYYDGLMTHVLSDFYEALQRTKNVLFSRWRLPREAKRLNTIRLDIMELTERIDNAIKFVSDTYFAQVYRLAASRMGVHSYRELVDEKLKTAGELYDFMMDEFVQARSFVLELGIAILILLEFIFLFRKP